MKLTTFAPHLSGRMLPAIFTYLGVGKKERFPGDPWPHLNAEPTWYWMHATGCTAGLFRDFPMRRQAWPETCDWISPPAAVTIPAVRAPVVVAQAELFEAHA